MWALISDYIGTILNVVSCILFARIVLSEKVKPKKIYVALITIAFAACLQLLIYLNLDVIKTIFCFITIVFLYNYFYSLKIMKSIVLTFMYFIIQILSDMMCIKIFTIIFNKDYFYFNIASSFVGNLLVFVIMILITFILRKLIYKIINIKLRNWLLVLLIFTIICILATFYSTFKYGSSSIDNFLGFCILLVILIFLGYSFIQVYKNNQLTTEYDNLLTFIKKYEAEIDKQRTLRHETKNQFLIIKSKIIDKENDSAIIDYIDELLNDGRKVKHSEYAKLKYLPSNGIRGLFYFKLALAQDKGININVTISDKMENSFLKDMDASNFNQIGKILGVYLDNAIESADLAKEKTIEVEVYEEEDAAVFIISNSYNPSIKKIGRSSKGVGHGYGLLLAKSIIKNNKKLMAETQASEDHYIKKLTIKK